jgi:hypothetical protein
VWPMSTSLWVLCNLYMVNACLWKAQLWGAVCGLLLHLALVDLVMDELDTRRLCMHSPQPVPNLLSKHSSPGHICLCLSRTVRPTWYMKNKCPSFQHAHIFNPHAIGAV